MPKASIWYLDHSGFAVESNDNIYIFDYFTDDSDNQVRNLNTGVVNPEDIKDKNIYVFSSHSHFDHFNPVILEWEKIIPDIKYIFSSDISIKDNTSSIVYLDSHQTYKDGSLYIETLESTDLGVAFYIEDKNINIFHGGDLNWWHWIGETDEYNKDMEIKYKGEINKLKKHHIDIAFIPVDPRLDKYYHIAVEYFIDSVNVEKVFPMHFQKDKSVFDRLKKNLPTSSFNKIQNIDYRGQKFTI